MPADGISSPPNRDFGTSRWGGSKVRLYQRRHRPEGVMTAVGTRRPRDTCADVRFRWEERNLMFAPEWGRGLTSGAGQFRSSENTEPRQNVGGANLATRQDQALGLGAAGNVIGTN